MIELKQVALSAGAFSLAGVSLAVAAGEYAVLMGATGSGKTTILEAICGLRLLDAGEIWLHGANQTQRRPAERGVGYVPQDLALFPNLTVYEHLAFALSVRRAAPALLHERVTEMASLLGLSPLLSRRPRGLSGGEAQRVALGRALSFHPPVLLLDEPLSALDEATRDDMYDLLRQVQRQTGVTVLHVTHSRAEAEALGQRLFVIEQARVVERALTAPSPRPSRSFPTTP